METRHMTYTQRLEYLYLPSLCHGRYTGDMIQVINIISGIDDMYYENFLNLLIMMVLEISVENNIFNKLEHKVKKCTFSRRSAPVWILSYHN